MLTWTHGVARHAAKRRERRHSSLCLRASVPLCQMRMLQLATSDRGDDTR